MDVFVDAVSRVTPREFEETYIRVFCRYKAQRDTVKEIFQQVRICGTIGSAIFMHETCRSHHLLIRVLFIFIVFAQWCQNSRVCQPITPMKRARTNED